MFILVSYFSSAIINCYHSHIAYSDCSPFIYCYQTIDVLKEAELARRQTLDYLLER